MTNAQNTTDTTAASNVTGKELMEAFQKFGSREKFLPGMTKAIGGRTVSDKVLATFSKSLESVFADKKNPASEVNKVVAVVKAAPMLPRIYQASQELYANKAVRKGNYATAMMAGIKAYNEGKGENAIVEHMATEYPLLDPKAVAKDRLLSLLKQCKDAASVANVNITTQLDKLIESI
jgi:hypothetical protein